VLLWRLEDDPSGDTGPPNAAIDGVSGVNTSAPPVGCRAAATRTDAVEIVPGDRSSTRRLGWNVERRGETRCRYILV
jgi:hypothetical protein